MILFFILFLINIAICLVGLNIIIKKGFFSKAHLKFVLCYAVFMIFSVACFIGLPIIASVLTFEKSLLAKNIDACHEYLISEHGLASESALTTKDSIINEDLYIYEYQWDDIKGILYVRIETDTVDSLKTSIHKVIKDSVTYKKEKFDLVL